MAPLASQHNLFAEKLFHVHLTGFGPFRNIKLNPSWQAVSQLHQTTLTSPPQPIDPPRRQTWSSWARAWLDWLLPAVAAVAAPHASHPTPRPTPRQPRPLYLTTSQVPVTYRAVERIVPGLHAPPNGDAPPDLVVHVGVGRSGRLTLEQRGRRWGYNAEDAEHELCVAGQDGRRGGVDAKWAEVVEPSAEGEEQVRTSVNGGSVQAWAKAMGVEKLEISEDAGLYLCEFITFSSTATAKLNAHSSHSNEVPVQFIHVPAIGEPYTLEELTQALRIITWAIVNEGGLSAL